MERTRRSFDAGFKLQVARMVRDQGLSVGNRCGLHRYHLSKRQPDQTPRDEAIPAGVQAG